MRRLARLQVALGTLWLVDGTLQLQPANLASGPARAITDNAMGQPSALQSLLVAVAARIGREPIASSVAIAAVQLALGAAILVPRSRRIGLLASIPWALGIWVLADGLGGVATGFGSLTTGTPGAALLCAAAAAVLCPSKRVTCDTGDEGCAPTAPIAPAAPAARPWGAGATPGEGLAATRYGLLGERGTDALWAAAWGATAVVQSIPVVTLGSKLSAGFQMASLGEPAALAGLDRSLARVAAGHGAAATCALVAVELAAGGAALARGPWRGRLLVVATAACAITWVAAENFGGLLTGSATDVGAMPLYVILAAAMYAPHRRAHHGPAARASASRLAPSPLARWSCSPAGMPGVGRAPRHLARGSRIATGRCTTASRASTEPAPTRTPPAASVG